MTITADRSLLLRIRAEVDEALVEPVSDEELALANDLDRVLREGGVL